MNSKALVIDTCIFRSAGMTNNPESMRSRMFLESVLKICHKVVFTENIYAEWERNRSRFSYSWLATMTAKKKVVRIKDEVIKNRTLRTKLELIELEDDEKEEIEKDIHLLEAALATDKIIISKDDKMQKLLAPVSVRFRFLRKIMWINPVLEENDNVNTWLKDGAEIQKHRCLGA